jgi:hypothetical protein
MEIFIKQNMDVNTNIRRMEMDMTNMKMDSNPSATIEAGNAPVSSKDSGPKYPYGLEIRLEKEQLNKLGLENCEIGDIYIITASADVKSVSENEGETVDGEDNYSKIVTLQITDMAIEEGPSDGGNKIGHGDPQDILNKMEEKMKDSIAYVGKKK